VLTVKSDDLGASYPSPGEGSGAMDDRPTGDAIRRNVDVVRRCYEAVGRDDVPAVLDLLTDDVEWTLQGPPAIPFAGTRRGHEGVAGFFSLVRETLKFLQFEIREFVAQGDTVIVLGHEHNLITPTGRRFHQEWAHVYGLRNGKIAAFRAFEDTAAYLVALNAG
jgi:uncharacterized protein